MKHLSLSAKEIIATNEKLNQIENIVKGHEQGVFDTEDAFSRITTIIKKEDK